VKKRRTLTMATVLDRRLWPCYTVRVFRGEYRDERGRRWCSGFPFEVYEVAGFRQNTPPTDQAAWLTAATMAGGIPAAAAGLLDTITFKVGGETVAEWHPDDHVAPPIPVVHETRRRTGPSASVSLVRGDNFAQFALQAEPITKVGHAGETLEWLQKDWVSSLVDCTDRINEAAVVAEGWVTTSGTIHWSAADDHLHSELEDLERLQRAIALAAELGVQCAEWHRRDAP